MRKNIKHGLGESGKSKIRIGQSEKTQNTDLARARKRKIGKTQNTELDESGKV
jgi:hypothetical protein